MNPQTCYEENIDKIMSIESNKTIKSTIPHKIVISESQELKIVLDEDVDALTARGLNPLIQEELSKKIAAYTYAVALCELNTQNNSSIQLNWNSKKEESYALKKKIIHEMEFAFSEKPQALKQLAEVKKGKSHKEMLINLLELEIIGRGYADLLRKTYFDFSLLEKLKTLQKEVTRAYADMKLHGNQINNTVVVRDKAYTWLKETINEIRKYGKFVFSNDPNRLKYYKCEYFQKLRTYSKVEKIKDSINTDSDI